MRTAVIANARQFRRDIPIDVWRNPWNGDYVTGGSSAGSAAAVAAGLCFATVDTDAVGSVRLPAACCGVVGFKGGSDLLSTMGILGDHAVDDFIRWMSHAAVTTRSAARWRSC